MGRLIYTMLTSLDGFIADGDYSWSAPDDGMLAALAADAAEVSTQLLGRRMYETMSVWETDPEIATGSPESAAFADAWQDSDKVVFSRTLERVHTRRTRLERRFDAELVTGLKADAPGDLSIEGPTLAAEAFRLGLVDVVELLLYPALLGGGIPILPAGVRLDLTLRRERRFDNGLIQATYDIRRD